VAAKRKQQEDECRSHLSVSKFCVTKHKKMLFIQVDKQLYELSGKMLFSVLAPTIEAKSGEQTATER
jgi:hypothetical protein